MNARQRHRSTRTCGSIRLAWTLGAAAVAALCGAARATTVMPGQTLNGSAFTATAMTSDTLIASQTNPYTIMDGSTPVSSGVVTSEVYRNPDSGDLTFAYDIGFTSDGGSYTFNSYSSALSTDVEFVEIPQDASVTVSRDLASLLTINAGSEPPDLAGHILVKTDAKNYTAGGDVDVTGYSDTYVGGVPMEISGSELAGVLVPAIPVVLDADPPAVPLPAAAWMGLAGIAATIVVQARRRVAAV